jgi:DNA-binding HxlR family transcriptional regulator
VAGEQALSCLGAPLSFSVLKSLSEEAEHILGGDDLRRAVGSPPMSTMRVYMREMEDLRLILRTREKSFPGTVHCELTPAGEQLLQVGEVLEDWLREAPHGPVSLGTPAAKSHVKALLEGWSVHAVRLLAAKSLSLTEVHRFIPAITYPSLERRLSAMNHAGLLERLKREGRHGNPYRATRWLRRAAAPLAAAIAWERHCVPDLALPIRNADIEALFLMLVPLLKLPQSAWGLCRLDVELKKGEEREFPGVSIGVEGGEIISCTTRWEKKHDLVVSGDPLDWINWIAFKDKDAVAITGDRGLARALAMRTREALKTVSAQPA